MKSISFRQFIEEEESPDKPFQKIGQELGVGPDDWANHSSLAADVRFDGDARNLAPYSILQITKKDGEMTGAFVKFHGKLGGDRIVRRFQKTKNGWRDDKESESRVIWVSADKLEKLATQGLEGGAGMPMGGPPPGM